MASRRRAREFALQALYQSDIASIPVSRALEDLWAEQLEEQELTNRPAEAEEVAFARRLAEGVDNRRGALDVLIESASLNWRLARMPVVDRNILRLASFELVDCPDIPASVSINEAVELAKRFGDKDSRSFVNGILDRIAAETGRGGRRHRRR
ncbi:MAG: transcription antitermination factor NusB [Myxococcota bacterium]